MGKFRLFEFKPTPYPRKLYVAFGGTKKDIEKWFLDPDCDNYQISESELEDSNCITLPYVIEKKDAWRGILVWLHKPEVMTVWTIAHEADHVANAIFKACGQGLDTGDDEMHSYLVGWAAECIDEVLQKAKKSNG